MADRFPLIINSVDQQIQELSSGDNLDLTGNSLINANHIQTSGMDVVGVMTATKFKGDGSELEDLPATGGTLEATASGTLADGSTVIVNTDGTVSVVSQTETLGAGAGTPEVFASTSTNAARSATYDSTNNKVVVAYQDGWDSDHGKAVVGEISGTDITFGAPVKFASNGKTDKIAATFDSTNSRVVIAYEDAGNSSYGTAVVGEVSLATPNAFPNNGRTWSDASQTNFNSSTFSNAFDENATSYAETTGTNQSTIGSITFDPPLPISSITTFKVSSAANGNNSQNWGFNGGSMTARVCNGITDLSDLLPSSGNLTSLEIQKTGNGVAVINEIEINGERLVDKKGGHSISFGTPEVYEFATTTGGDVDTAITFDSTNGKVVIAYRDAGNSNYGTAIVGEVDPNDNSIDFGTPEVFYQGNAQYISATFDSTNSRVVIAYSNRQSGQAYQGEAIVGTVSGNSISFPNSAFEFNSARSDYITATFDASKSRVVIAYISMASSPSGYGTAIVGEVNPSNNSITYGSQVNFNTTGSTPFSSAVYDASNNNVVISYMDNGNSAYGTAIIGTVDPNNNSIEFGTPVVFESAGSYWTSSTYTTDGKVVISYLDNGNSNYGTSVVFGQTGFSPVPEIGSPEIYNSAAVRHVSSTFDSTNGRVVIAYRDDGNSYYGTAVVGQVSGTDITFGTPVVFESALTQYTSTVHDSANNKIVIAYSDDGNSSRGTAVVGTIDTTDNSIEFGTPVVFRSASCTYISAAYDASAQKVVVAYQDGGNSDRGYTSVLTVSGNSVTYGSYRRFSGTGRVDAIATTYDSTNGKVVIAYQDGGSSSYGTAIVAYINPGDTENNFGSPTIFEYAGTYDLSAAYDSSNQKVVITYKDSGNSWAGTAIVGEVSGNSISFNGTASVFASNPNGTAVVYDSSEQKVVIVYGDAGTGVGDYGTVVMGEVSGNNISFGSGTVFNSATTYYYPPAYDSTNNRTVIPYYNQANSGYGTGITFTPRTLSRNLTAENYIGISNGAYTDGQTATVQIIGAVDDAQSSLTPGQKYYVQNDGTLSTTADDPSVLAGTAVAATKLMIKK